MAQPHLTIIGGGITGLASAYLASQEGWRVTVLEGSARVGGLLETFPTAGDPLECFYHHFFTHDAELRWLVRELGVTDELEFPAASMGIARDGKIYPFNGPADLLRFSPLGWIDKLRFAGSSLYLSMFADWRRWENTSALSWFERHAGKTATDAIWRPMLEIKFGPYAPQVPVSWIVGRLRQRVRSRERGSERLGYLRGSLRLLLERLVAKLKERGVEIVVNARAESFKFESGRLTAVDTPLGRWAGDRFLATLPTIHLAPLVAAANPEFAARLNQIEYFGALCVVLELSEPLSQTYWLNVADPGFPFGGVIEHTNLVPPSRYGGSHLVYLSRYFEAGNAIATQPEAEVLASFLAALRRLYPHFAEKNVRRSHVFRARTAATVCDLGFSQKIPPWRSPIENLFLASMCHVYPDERSCNNSIRIAADACMAMGLQCASVPRGSTFAGQALRPNRSS